MNREATEETPVRFTTQIHAGVLRCHLPPEAASLAGAAVGLFVGDYALGATTLQPAEESGLRAEFSLAELPSLEDAIEFRFMLMDQQLEIKPPLAFRDAGELLAACGFMPISIALASFDGRAISFAVEPKTLPLLPRRLELMVDGRKTGAAKSVPPKTKDGANPAHSLHFKLSNILRDGSLIELIDCATGRLVFSQSLTWLTIAGSLMTAHRDLEERHDKMAAEFTRLRSKVSAMGDISRDMLMLERLDLYHGMMMDRLDREFAAMRRELGLGNTPPPPAANLPTRLITPAELEGVGFYHIENTGGRQWRWFGPDTTLIIRNAAPSIGLIRLHFTLPAAEAALGTIDCQVNAVPAQITDFGTTLDISLTSQMHRPDGSLIVHLRFDSAFTPENDSRALCIACAHVELLR